MKKQITYSKNEAIFTEKFNWSVFVKGNSCSSALKKNASKDKKLTEQGLSEIVSETKIIKLLREDEENTSNEELFASFQKEETSFSVSHASVEKTVVGKQKSQEKNQQYSENENILDEYINILNHSLITEAVGSYPHEHKQPSQDVTTSDYVSSNQLTNLKNSYAQYKKNVELTSQSNFYKSLTDLGIISLKTNNAIPEKNVDDVVDEPFCTENSKPSSEAYKFDCSKNISQKQNNILETMRLGLKHGNKGKTKIGQGGIAAFPKENEILRGSRKQSTINIKRKPQFVKQPHVVMGKQNLDIRNKSHAEEITLKSTEYSLACNNHMSTRKEDSNSETYNFCGAKISSLIQHDTPLGSAGNLKSRRNKSNPCTNENHAVSLNIQNPLKTITYGRTMKENVKPAAIEQILVTMKKKQNIHQGVTVYPEEKVLVKTLFALRNSKHISIKSSVPRKKQVKCKHVSRNTFSDNLSNKQLKCSTPANASQFRTINFHYLSRINSDKDIEASSFCVEKNISPHRSLTNNSVSVANSSRNQKLIQHQIDQLSSFPTVIEDANQDFVELLSHCEYRSVISFSKAYTWSNLLCKKIGEGSYGEVFSLKKKSEDMKVLKIIPLSVLKNVSGQIMSCMDVYHEIAVCKYMNSLQNSLYNSCSNFIKMNKVFCVKGHYPPQLKKAWCTFKRARNNQSFNPHPGTYINEQSFVMFEFEFGGETLEKYKIKSASGALSIFHQIAMSLAVAEVECEFEHRDLHLSNVLITSTNSESIDYHIEGSLIGVPSFNILVKIIDFTLSRLTTREGSVLSIDIDEDDSLLLQFGDEQFDIYRKTDRCLSGNWKGSCPYTNIMWLHYILKNILSRNSVKKTNTDAEKVVLCYLQSIERELLEYKSAKDYVMNILI